MTESLAAYLAEVERGLRGLPGSRRRLVLRELEGHLLDEAEARGMTDEAAMRTLLAEKEAPELLAKEIAEGEDGDASHRSETALIAGAFLGLATGGYLWLQGNWPWYLSVAFGTAHGLAVGTGIFLVRPRWQRLGPQMRLLASVLFGTLLAIPLGFTGRRGFIISRLLYGAFTGYLVERHSQNRPAWQPVVETLAVTVLDFCLEILILQRYRNYAWMAEVTFFFTLTLAVLAVMALRRAISGRWVLTAESKRMP